MEKKLKTFKQVYKINVNSLTEKKNGLTYLSWAHAWKIFKEEFPNANYEVLRFDEGKPYFEDSFGVMVFTKVTVGDVTHEMWLPVMDSYNKAMKSKSYEYITRAGKRNVAPATMFDINKTIMRCLTKNLAMFGLGLYIYAGEDLPEDISNVDNKMKTRPSITPEKFKRALESIKKGEYTALQLTATFNLSDEQMETLKNSKKNGSGKS